LRVYLSCAEKAEWLETAIAAAIAAVVSTLPRFIAGSFWSGWADPSSAIAQAIFDAVHWIKVSVDTSGSDLRLGSQRSLVNAECRRAVDQQAQQFRPAVVAARVHQVLAPVDPREVEISDHDAFAGAHRLADERPVGRDDRGEAPARQGTGVAAGVSGDLRLLIGIEPRGRADDEAPGLQRVLPDVDLRLLGEQRPEDRPGYIAEWISSPSAIIA
jgi:hypothetical protein